jgi:flagellar biosynthetic protein FliR
MLAQLVGGQIFQLFLVFCRIGSAMMLLPGLGEQTISTRIKLLLALGISVVVAPLVAPMLPAMPADPASLLLILGGEIAVGIFIGTVARTLFNALSIAGTLIAFQTGLASAQVLNPALAEQESLPGVLLGLMAIVIIFETDLHAMMLRGLVDSYMLFTPGHLPPVGDFTEAITKVTARAFRIGLQLAAPFIVISTVLMAALGLLSRLVPSLQIFFLALPLQLGIGLGLIAVTLPTVLLYFFDDFASALGSLLAP